MPTTSTEKIAYSINLNKKTYKKLDATARRLGVHKSVIVHAALNIMLSAKDLKLKLE